MISFGSKQKGPGRFTSKPLKLLAPGAGFEPATNRLTVDCSTAELSGIDGRRIARRLGGRKPFTTCRRSFTEQSYSWSMAGCGRARHVVIAPLKDFCSGLILRKASWRSGYAEDCKSLHPGSIPGEASRISLTINFPEHHQRPATVGRRLVARAGWPCRLAFCGGLEQKAVMGGR
jgi:hypothetical protein